MIKHDQVDTAPQSTDSSKIDSRAWNAGHLITDPAAVSGAIGVHVVAGSPNGTVTGLPGELARDTVNGQLWEALGGTAWTALVRADGGTSGVRLDGLTLNNSGSPSVGPELNLTGQNSTFLIGIDVANAPTSRDCVQMGVRGTYSFPDGVTTNGSATLTSASGGGFTAAVVGAAISGNGIPGGATVLAVGGITSLTMSANASATASSVRVTITRPTVQDLAYWKHRGALSPTLGVGLTPPDGSARLQVSAQDDEPAMATMRLRRGPSQTGNILTLHDSNPTDRIWVDKDFWLSGSNAGGGGGAIAIAADSTNQRAIMWAGSDKANVYGFSMPTGSGGVCRFSCFSGGSTCFDVGTDGSLRHLSTKFGAFGATAITKPTVTGSRGGNAALASLLTALANLGWITDSTSA